MLYALVSFSDQIGPLNVFRYITFRTGGAIMTALLFVFLFGPAIIDILRVKQGKGQPIREDGPQTHFAKRGTPTMGGLMILSGITVATLLWANLSNLYVWIVLFVTLGFGAIGFYDDYLKVINGAAKGFSGRMRLLAEVMVAGTAAYAVMRIGTPGFSSSLTVPFFKTVSYPLGVFGFIVLTYLVIVGASNAVNLTDGMDGLASGSMVIASLAMAAICVVVGRAPALELQDQLVYVRQGQEMTVFCTAMAGATLGFLWFNAAPALVYMGDTGSLPLGSLLGYVAVVAKQELLLVIVGGVFALEALSVIAQVGFFKATGGRRLLRCAPLHHHFQFGGVPDQRIVVRFWIVGALLAGLGMASLAVG